MSNSAPAGDSLARKLALLRTARDAIERLAADYHSAIRPVQVALEAVANVPLTDRTRWAGAVSALACQLTEAGIGDVPATLETVERWDRQFDAGLPGQAVAGKAFCTALAATVADGTLPVGFFSTLDQHPFITTPDATREVCAVLTQLLYVHTQRTTPGFASRYAVILTEAGTDGDTLRDRLGKCGMSLSVDAAAAIAPWNQCRDGSGFYAVHISPFADRATANDKAEGSEAGPRQSESYSHRELRECVPLVENPRPYQPKPPRGRNPYLTLRHILHELFWQAAVAQIGQDVREHINPTTGPWNEAEARARACSAGWGIPFATFDPILADAKRTLRELVQVAAGNTSVAFSPLDTRFPMLEERLRELADSIPLVQLYGPMPAAVRNWLTARYLADPTPGRWQLADDAEPEPVVFVRYEDFAGFLVGASVELLPNLDDWTDAGWIEDVYVELTPTDNAADAPPYAIDRLNLPLGRHRLVGIRRTVLDAPTTQTPPNATTRDEAEKPPPDPYAELRRLARGLSKQERAVIEALCDARGELSLADVKTLCDWHAPIESAWNSLRMRLNKKLTSHGWEVKTQAGTARLTKPDPE